VAGFRAYRGYHTFQALGLYEELIVSGAWWDLVDESSTHVGWILERSPEQTRTAMLAWARSADLWKRRTSIICQGSFKQRTDLELLYACIEPSLDTSEFFLQKAIGWALRDVAWFDPKEAVRYVREHKARLSPLAKREALKNLLKQGVVRQVP
jgi:3-methyladenine DNA glycosylase AlkD